MQRLDNYEETNSKCHMCTNGLSLIEHLLYGNRCLFCAMKPGLIKHKEISLSAYLHLCYWDWKIYIELCKLRYEPDSHETYLAILGMSGYQDINEVNTIKKKKELYKRIREVK